MRMSPLRPRPDQVAELTRGVNLPLPALGMEHLYMVIDSLRRAFVDVRARFPERVLHGHEAEVTGLLQSRLNALRSEDRLWRQLVLWVARGAETVSFDGSHLEKRPDLTIVLSQVDGRFPLHAEAKVLDVGGSQPLRLYFEKGVSRFVQGQYGWGRREAVMLAYVRDGSSLDPTLTSFLSKAARSDHDPYGVEVSAVCIDSHSADLAHSRHRRSFSYRIQGQAGAPGPISLWHLWLA